MSAIFFMGLLLVCVLVADKALPIREEDVRALQRAHGRVLGIKAAIMFWIVLKIPMRMVREMLRTSVPREADVAARPEEAAALTRSSIPTWPEMSDVYSRPGPPERISSATTGRSAAADTIAARDAAAIGAFLAWVAADAAQQGGRSQYVASAHERAR